MLKVVSNSSPLIHLAKVDLLNLLHNQFNEILVPKAVWREAVEEAGNEPDAKAISKASWIKVQEVSSSPLLTNLLTFLDKGESEAIALAIEIGADLILIDDSDARQSAECHGIKKIGLLGVLIKAKRQGNIPSLNAILDQLCSTGFRLSKKIYNDVLQAVGEK